jgi:hypothetical protein
MVGARFKYRREPAAPGWLEFIIGWEGDGATSEMQLFISPPGETYGFVSLNGDLTFDAVDKNDWAVDSWYRVKIERNGATGDLRGKVWLDAGEEPDWQFSATCTPPTGVSTLTVTMDNESAFEDNLALYRWDVDFVEDCGDCLTAGEAMGMWPTADTPIALPLEVAAKVSFPNFINEAGRRYAVTIGLSDSGIFSSRQNGGIAAVEVGEVPLVGFVGADGYIVTNAESGNSLWPFPTKALALSDIGSGWFWIKCRIEADTVLGKAWPDGVGEPASWESSTSRTSQPAHVISNLTNIIVSGSVDIFDAAQPQVLVDEIVVSVGDAEERETFTKVLANAWGASEMFGQIWTQAEGSSSDVSVDGTHGTIGNASTSGATFLLSTVGVVIPGTDNPCGTEDEPDPDEQNGYICENLTRVQVDGDGDTHLRATSQFEPRSTRVWADGKLLRRNTDYLEYPLLAKIEVYSHVDLGGWAAADPSKPVHMCYYATAIDALDPPEPL